ncbi:hypothetical protein LNKW23_35760 [Paralimibaculum aggregatum]|uniref:Glycosyltransferase 2-like domain-containing protein n=1 Tax=Paralimibaculum aggregatum TaxID=3036245 RepID=A0ABQ6LMD0_9RHOB|nr:glycosyltransferase family 2 protein [Limibaculum sp. NKW23]GMG84361.1 hypothetical protein LNKW23_35760 [Limibaculum sp. NKW23]
MATRDPAAEGAGEAPPPPPPAPEVSILVVSYNTREMTLACLASVIAETPELPHELIVLDNASADGSADAIAAAHPDIPLIRLAENIGFGRGNNRAAEAARGRYLLLLNPDTVVRDRAIERLVAFARRRPEAMIWGGRTIFADGSPNPSSAWGRLSLWSLTAFATGLSVLFPRSELTNPEGIGGWGRDTERGVDIVSGCFLLIERAFWERLGGFDPDYFMYAEEADLCHRARALGARPRCTPEAMIVHHGGASERVRTEKALRLLSGKATLIAKHWSPPAAWAGRNLYRLGVGLRALGYGLAARLTGRQRHREAAEPWAALWRRQAEWIRGYPPAGER